MGHVSPEISHRLITKGFVTGVKLSNSPAKPTFCESCIYAKATRKSIPKVHQGERAKEIGGEVHSDIWGPALVATLHGRRYYVSFINDKTRYGHAYFFHEKSGTFNAYKQFEAHLHTQYTSPIKTLHSDREGEYFDKEFVWHLKSAVTKQKMAVYDTQSENGVAE
jgi:hypothetical protein